MPEFIVEIDATQFDSEVTHAAGAVVVDFFSTECPPCEALAPKYAAIAEQYAGRAKFLKIFRQGNRELAQRLGVTGSPTLLFFRAGQEVGMRLMGDIKRSDIKTEVEKIVR